MYTHKNGLNDTKVTWLEEEGYDAATSLASTAAFGRFITTVNQMSN